jgi:hypothetical protein
VTITLKLKPNKEVVIMSTDLGKSSFEATPFTRASSQQSSEVDQNREGSNG